MRKSPDSSHESARSFEEVLSPLHLHDFAADGSERSFKVVRGHEEKFAGLITWEVLNRLLAEHRLEHPRLRLVKKGEPVPESEYLRHARTRRGADVPILVVPTLSEHLSGGATLVVDAVDELHYPIRKLAQSFESVFRERVQVNAYVGWGISQGFAVHWDDHDVFAVQVEGKKHWRVYGISRRYPLYRDVEESGAPPDELVWEGEISAGDLLYVPRGWWHMAEAVGGPTIHLTFGVNNRNGVHLVEWMAERCAAEELFRQDLPRYASTEQRREHASELRSRLVELWTPEVLDEFLQAYDARAVPRNQLSLPWVITGFGPNDTGCRVKLTTPPALPS